MYAALSFVYFASTMGRVDIDNNISQNDKFCQRSSQGIDTTTLINITSSCS